MEASERELKFLGHTVKVKYVSAGPSSPLDTNDFGMWSLDDMTMYVNKDVDADLQSTTILHEAIHIMQHLLDVEIDHKDVQIVSQSFFHLLKNNRWVLENLLGGDDI